MNQHLSEEQTVAASIAAMADKDIARFIREQSSRKVLSRTMQLLNRGALSEHETDRELAKSAIRKLGFI